MIDWEKLYLKYIDKCKSTLSDNNDRYTHHIIPRSSGGTNDSSNLISLTYKQHVLAHFMLYKWNPTNANYIAYKMMSGLDQSKKICIENLRIKRVKESTNNRKWDPQIIEQRKKTLIETINNMPDKEFYEKYIDHKIGSKHPMYGKKRPGSLAGNYGKTKGKYILIQPDLSKIEFSGIKQLIDYGVNELTIRKWTNKGVIMKDPKCNKPYKWDGFEIKFII